MMDTVDAAPISGGTRRHKSPTYLGKGVTRTADGQVTMPRVHEGNLRDEDVAGAVCSS